MPAAARRGCDQRVMSWPANSMRPSLGGTSPDSMLTSVDLPAPLVPITACTSPGSSASDTDPTAVSPPKRRVSETACSSGAGSAAMFDEGASGADQALRQQRDERDDGDAEGELPVCRHRTEPGF